jgi:predicted membrane GTPase involved in stress response
MLFEIYPEQKRNKERYTLALKEIRGLKPTHKEQFVVHCKKEIDEDGDVYYNVFGANGEMWEYSPNEEKTWALEYSPWDEWLGWETEFVNMTKEQFLAHCLFEMTSNGFSYKEQQKRSKVILGW